MCCSQSLSRSFQFNTDTDKLMCRCLSEGIFSSAKTMINGHVAIGLFQGHFSSAKTQINWCVADFLKVFIFSSAKALINGCCSQSFSRSFQQYSKDTDKLMCRSLFKGHFSSAKTNKWMCYSLSEGHFSLARTPINGCGAVNLAKGLFSSAKILVTGCFSQSFSRSLHSLAKDALHDVSQSVFPKVTSLQQGHWHMDNTSFLSTWNLSWYLLLWNNHGDKVETKFDSLAVRKEEKNSPNTQQSIGKKRKQKTLDRIKYNYQSKLQCSIKLIW